MKILRKLIAVIGGLAVIGVVGAVILPGVTKNQHSEWAMAADNVNPLVKTTDVYASTNAKPVRHYIGGGGEDEYVYQLLTYNAKGEARTLTFDSQWRLKPNKFLKITAKGQNVETWEKVERTAVPSHVRQNLMTE